MLTKKRLLLRAIAGSLCAVFVAGELRAAPAAAVTPAFDLARNPELFQAPEDFAQLSEIHKGGKSSFIIHIQDAHSNFSGQSSLANALDELMGRYGASLVL